MKKFVILMLLLVTSLLGFSQSQYYYNLISHVESTGFSVVSQKYATVTEGNYMYFTRDFAAGNGLCMKCCD